MARAPRVWMTYAMLDYGDHGLGAVRQDPRRVGIIEVTERLRWVPGEGEGFEVDVRSVKIRSARPWLGMMFDGVELELGGVGSLRIRALGIAPGLAVPVTSRSMGDARASGRLRAELLRRGAIDASQEPVDVDDAY